VLPGTLTGSLSYRAGLTGAKQVKLILQGGGGGSVRGPGSGSATRIERCIARLLLEAGEIDAETRPATATNSANMRMAVFIFGNLVERRLRGNPLLFGANRTLENVYMSIIFNKIDSNLWRWLLT
jgi:hypothetical protein